MRNYPSASEVVFGLQDTKGQVKYVGGSSYLDSILATLRYADLAFRLTEKVNGAVSIKYLPPGDELDEDNLIGIWDDADVQVCPSERLSSSCLLSSPLVFTRVVKRAFPASLRRVCNIDHRDTGISLNSPCSIKLQHEIRS